MADTLFILCGINVTWWKILGWTGVFMFTGRWLVQMHYSRKAGKPVIPRLYWFMSMAGSLILLCYFCMSPQKGTVGFLANFFPLFVAAYNLMLDLKSSTKAPEPA